MKSKISEVDTKSKFSIPVLFICYNRPEYTRKVLEQIKNVSPKRLYIVQNHYKIKKDKNNWIEVRNIIKKNSYGKKTIRLLREEHLPVHESLRKSIDWFFQKEKMGIILEDDCVPSESFFYFCQLILQRYKNDPRVAMVAGTNYMPDEELKADFHFSNFYPIWGWATWKRSWSNYDHDLSQWSLNKKYVLEKIPSLKARAYYRLIFRRILNKDIRTWDYQWMYSCIISKGLCATPSKNLVTNIGIHGDNSIRLTKFHNLRLNDNFKIGNNLDFKCVKENKEFNKRIYNLMGKQLNFKFLMDEALLIISKIRN